jgi:hypothetical protein
MTATGIVETGRLREWSRYDIGQMFKRVRIRAAPEVPADGELGSRSVGDFHYLIDFALFGHSCRVRTKHNDVFFMQRSVLVYREQRSD